ncbi:MAG: VTT domain-containing protein [Desulfurococcales archaeon]|nr:VTT domain-containing protein [Desulfurococcales archaeon]
MEASLLDALRRAMEEYGLLGFTLAAFVSNLIPGFPAFYLTIVVSYSIASDSDVVGLLKFVIAGGVAAGLGKFVEFYVSRLVGSRVRAVREKSRSLERLLAGSRRSKLGVALLVFLFAALPLPDDVLYIPLGVAGFSRAAFLASVVLGKTVLTALVAALGAAAKWLVGEGALTPARIAGLAVGTTVVLLLVFAVDWERIIDGYASGGWRGACRALVAELAALPARISRRLNAGGGGR